MADGSGSTSVRLREALAKASRAASAPVAAARRHPRLWIGLAAAIVAAAASAGIALAVYGPPDFGPFAPRNMADLKRRAQENPSDARAQRALGHAQYAAGRRADALASYGRALAIDPGAADARVVANVAACFGRAEQHGAEALLAKHGIAAAAPRLEPLAKDDRFAVRWGAVRTLHKLGKDTRDVWLGAYAADLASPDCEVRRRAVEKLGAMGDRSALSALRRAKEADEKSGGWFRSRCLGRRLDDAEKAILAGG